MFVKTRITNPTNIPKRYSWVQGQTLTVDPGNTVEVNGYGLPTREHMFKEVAAQLAENQVKIALELTDIKGKKTVVELNPDAEAPQKKKSGEKKPEQKKAAPAQDIKKKLDDDKFSGLGVKTVDDPTKPAGSEPVAEGLGVYAQKNTNTAEPPPNPLKNYKKDLGDTVSVHDMKNETKPEEKDETAFDDKASETPSEEKESDKESETPTEVDKNTKKAKDENTSDKSSDEDALRKAAKKSDTKEDVSKSSENKGKGKSKNKGTSRKKSKSKNKSSLDQLSK